MIQRKLQMFDALTGIRALGAWWIVAYHMGSQLNFLLPKDSFLMRLANVGHIGITLFFILSGFVISYNYAERFQDLSLGYYVKFLWQRLARIYPVHLAMLLVLLCSVFLANLGKFSLNNPERYTTGSFIRHLLLTNSWEVPFQTTWNGVAWTLSLEWLCYLIFPFVAFVACRIRNPSKLIVTLIFFLICTSIFRLAIGMPSLLFNPINFFNYLIDNWFALMRHPALFLLGFLMYRLYIAQVGFRLSWKYFTPAILFCLVTVSLLEPFLNTKNLLVTPFWALLIYSLTWDNGSAAKLFQSNFMMHWGYMSYALFMTHPISLMILNKILPFDQFTGSSFAVYILLFLLYILFVALVAWLTYAFVEEPARGWMRSRFDQFSSSKKLT